MKKTIALCLIGALAIFANCKKSETGQSAPSQPPGRTPAVAAANQAPAEKNIIGKCQEGKVPLPNYGDPGKRLSNCFVQYPGEPSRQDSHYYIVEDICGQFTREFIENLLGVPIVKIKGPPVESLSMCHYYLSEEPAGIGQYLFINLEYLSVEGQKKGHQMMSRTIKTDSRIPMEHFLVWQPDGLLNEIYLVLDPKKFISVNRSDSKVLDNEKTIEFAAKLAREIKDYR